jgi:hypothetical protein
LPQLPQWLLSLSVFLHEPSHFFWPGPQPPFASQTPLTQFDPASHSASAH